MSQAGMETTIRAAVAEQIGAARYGLWFGEGVKLDVSGDALDVSVPNAFIREWIRGHFADDLLEAARSVAGRALRLAVRVADEAEPALGDVVDPAAPAPDPRRPSAPPVTIPAPEPKPSPTDRPRPRAAGRPLRALAAFVPGPGSRLAHAAAVEMAATAGSAFNPLVIHGGVGMGKTHLLEGIASALRAKHPGMKVVLLTAETFTNDFLEAMRAGTLAAFRARYRGVGALVVDDVHFLAAKKATQDEFLHTFNALLNEGAAVVLACDQHPRRLAKLSDELATRFAAGMVVKLDAPDPATRRAILRSKAEARRVDVPEAVIGYVAEHLRGSVRELEGALHSLIAHATLAGRRLDLALAKTALRDTIRHTAQAVALRDVERAACHVFHLDADDLKSASRARRVAYPRMVAMYLARKHAGAAYSEIGRFFGGRNHSTAISAEKKVAGWLADQARVGLLAGFESVADVLAELERSLGV